MGAGMVMRVQDEKGQEKYVRLNGAEKAMVYRVLANFGVYEQDVPDSELRPEEKMPTFTTSQPEDRKTNPLEPLIGTILCSDLRREMSKDLGKGKGGSVNASTMHCCEAAEIVFEDIT